MSLFVRLMPAVLFLMAMVSSLAGSNGTQPDCIKAAYVIGAVIFFSFGVVSALLVVLLESRGGGE